MSDAPTPPQGPEEQKPASPDPTLPAGGTAGASAGAAPYASPATENGPDAADVEKNKVFAALSYVFILWLVPLFAAKDSPYAKFHANQGIMLTIVGFVGGIGVFILAFVLRYIPFLGCCGNCILWIVYMGGMLALAVLGLVNALTGKMKPLPMFPAMTIVK